MPPKLEQFEWGKLILKCHMIVMFLFAILQVIKLVFTIQMVDLFKMAKNYNDDYMNFCIGARQFKSK